MTVPRPPRLRAAAAARTGHAAKASSPAAPASGEPGDATLTDALRRLMAPLAQLAIGRGVPYVSVEELLKSAFVDAARQAHPELPSHRLVSRISTATGINRREVTRLSQLRRAIPAPHHSPATRVFTRWIGDDAFKGTDGTPRVLPRVGPAPSFESLAHSVTKDVHPRSLLDELRRLGLVTVSDDSVTVLRDSFVPRSDDTRLLGFLGSNVGDHLAASVANVLTQTPTHLEQAVFADELSPQSVQAFAQLARAQWAALLAAMVPALQQWIDDDRTAGRARDQRVRVGLYTYSEPIAQAAAEVTPSTKAPRRRAPAKATEK